MLAASDDIRNRSKDKQKLVPIYASFQESRDMFPFWASRIFISLIFIFFIFFFKTLLQ